MGEAIFRPAERAGTIHEGADTGIGVLIRIERAADVRGNPLA